MKTRTLTRVLAALAASCLANAAFANHAPVAVPGGPYLVYSTDSFLDLSGLGSVDPDFGVGDSIVSFQWDFVSNGAGTDFSGPTPHIAVGMLAAYGVSVVGAPYLLKLKVMDTYGLTAEAATTVMLTGTPAPVPEPETYAMFLAGLGLMGAVARRRRA